MRNILIAGCMATICLVACSRDKITDPEMSVSTASLNYQAGDSVVFNLSGGADNIVFYSGEPGRMYENRKRTKADNKVTFSFTSLVAAGLIYNNLKVLVSVNYNGLPDTNSIKAATWVDVSARANFSIGRDSLSGTVDITDIAATAYDAPLYIAFRYTDYKKTQGQNRWTIKAFAANSISPEGLSVPLAAIGDAGWQAVSFKNATAKWTISATQLQMYGGNSSADDNDDWVITKGFNTSSINPDAGVAVKNISTALAPVGHRYMTPGTYKAVFDISNVRYDGNRQMLREVVLNIQP